jgi:hypothetical protein
MKSFIFEGKQRILRKLRKTRSIITFPLLKKEFLKKKNNIDPKYISLFSNIRFYWKCSKGHVWQAAPQSRFRTPKKSTHKITLCPYCRGVKITRSTSFAGLNKIALKFWDFEINKDDPYKIASTSKKKFWWKCNKSHSFTASIIARKMSPDYCGYCDGHYAYKKNNLKITHPKLTNEWNYEKNGSLTPETVTSQSEKLVSWICSKNKNHKWRTPIARRANYLSSSGKKGTGCPFCSNKYLSPDKTNSLAFLYPHLVKEFHPSKNGKIKPDQIKPGSNKKVWWICSRGHEWETMPAVRVKGSNCSKCSGIGISYIEIRVFTELLTIFKDVSWGQKYYGVQFDIFIKDINLAVEVDGLYWHKRSERIKFDKYKSNLIKKNKLNLIRIRENGLPLTSELDFNAYFIRPKFELLSELLEKIKKFNLAKKYHSKVNEYLKEKKFKNNKEYIKIVSNLPSPTFENSLEGKNPLISKEWDHEKNSPLKPSMFKSGSNVDIWWLCKKNNHSYKAKIANRSQLGRGCPFCAGRYATKNKNLKILHPNLIKEWNYQFNKEKKPENFTPISGQYVWWDCEHGHIYRKAISHRTSPVKKGVRGGGGRNTKCPCQTKHQNGKLYSPAIFPLIRKEFSVKNKIKLTSLTILDKRQFFWVCKNNHKYKNSIFRRIFYNERCIDCFDYEIELRQPLHDPNESKMLK